MVTRHLTLLLLFPVLACVGISGCGSNDSAKASLTKDQYAKKANLICGKAGIEQYKEVNLYFVKHPNPGSLDALNQTEKAELMERAGIPPLQKEIQALKDLPAPSGFEAEINAFTAEFEEALGELKEEPLLMLSRRNPFDEANSLAEKYRLGDCSQHP